MQHGRTWARSGMALLGLGILGAGVWGLHLHAPGAAAAPPAPAESPAALAKLVAYPGSPTLLAAAGTGNLQIPTSGSSNWTGLTTTGILAKAVRATYTAPAWQGGAFPGQSVGDWVGLGGAQSRQLIQVGTVTTANRLGQPVTRAFWEQLPAAAHLGTVVPAGTRLTAAITPLGDGRWRLTLTSPERSAPWVDQVVTLTPAAARKVESSADVITEAITRNGHLVPLAPFGQTAFTGVEVDGVPLSRLPVADLAASVLLGPGGRPRAAAYYSPSAPNTMTVEEQAPAYGYGDGWGYGGGWGYGQGGLSPGVRAWGGVLPLPGGGWAAYGVWGD